MARTDVIGIGAINFDFIFSGGKADRNHGGIDEGEEIFVESQTFKDNFYTLQRHTTNEPLVQVGGSSLLAIRTLKDICPTLKTAYVGVYGKVPEYASGKKLPQTIEETREEFDAYIDNSEWLFLDDSYTTGTALVKLSKRSRQFINVDPGANVSLLSLIRQKGENSFIDFLSSAKWVHMTSLSNVRDFIEIARLVKKAKIKNPSLIFSTDPGYDYTKNKKKWNVFKESLGYTNYVFLSKSEYENITLAMGLSNKSKAIELAELLHARNSKAQILIIKGKSKITLLNMINETPFTRTYYHNKLLFTKMLNDTGAGDAFDGGFIAGMLSPILLSHQPAPIKLGTIAASERLKSLDWPSHLPHKAKAFFEENMRNERMNFRQWFHVKVVKVLKPFWTFILGILSGVIASIIFQYLLKHITI